MPVKDPVCGMEIEPQDAVATRQYKGRTFYFCSNNCVRKFDADPARYGASVSATTGVPANGLNLARITLPVAGLQKSGGPALEQAIGAVSGVGKATVNVKEGRVFVDYDPAAATVADLLHPLNLIKKEKRLLMKLLLVSLTLIALSLTAVQPALADSEHSCNHDMQTIASLHHCVLHAEEAGHIDKPGITKSLLAKVDAAEAAFNRGQSAVAINTLQAFIKEVQAQTGKHISLEHAEHLVEHAQAVIETLR